MHRRENGWYCEKCGGSEAKPEMQLFCSDEPVTAEEALERSRKLMKDIKGKPEVKMTVGDLTPQATEKRLNRVNDGMRWARNMEKGLTVGDLSYASGDGQDPRGLDDLYLGLDQLYVGSNFIPKATVARARAGNTVEYAAETTETSRRSLQNQKPND
jgi:hypothetical protein